MQPLVIPGWVWINLVLLVAAAIFVWLKLSAMEKAKRSKPEAKPLPADLGRATK